MPVDATPFGEPVRPHLRSLIAASLERCGVHVVDTPLRSLADIQALDVSTDLVFNLCYGLRTSEQILSQPDVAEAFETAGHRLVGSDAATQRRCQDKRHAGELAAAVGVSVPTEFNLTNAENAEGPLLIKPREGAAHRGIRIIDDPTQLTVADESPDVLIQEYLDGPEYTIGVVGNGATARPLPLMRVRYGRSSTPRIYEWGGTSTAPDSAGRFGLADAAVALFEALGMSDYARFDFRAIPGRGPVLMDANALPNLAGRQLLATSARWAGIDHPTLIRSIVASAHTRHSG